MAPARARPLLANPVAVLVLCLTAVSPISAAPGGLRLTAFNTTTFAVGDYATSPRVQVVPAPITLSGPSFVSDYASVRLEGLITAPESGNYSLFLTTDGAVRLFVDDHLVLNDVWQEEFYVHNSSCNYPAILIGGRPTPIRVEYQHNAGSVPPVLALLWALGSNASVSSAVPIPASALSSDVRACDDARWSLRDRLGAANPVQWQTSWIDHAGMHVHMASRLGISLTIVDTDSDAELIGGIRVFGHADPARVRLGPHSLNGSEYTQLNVSDWAGHECDVSFESTVANGGADLLLRVTATGADCAHMVVLVQPAPLWSAFNTIYEVAPGHITTWRPGFRNITLFSAQPIAPHILLTGVSMAVSLAPPSGSPNGTGTAVLGFSTGSRNVSVQEISLAVDRARSALMSTYSRYGPGELAEVGEAIETTIAWNTVFSAVVGHFTPVSRNWNWGVEQTLIFDWDTYFLAMQAAGLASAGGPGASTLCDIAIANTLVVSLTRTWRPSGEDGFVPNFHDYQDFSSDRSEPQVGSLALLKVLERCGGLGAPSNAWVVDYLFEQQLGWHNWVWDRRRGEGVLAAPENGGDGQSSVLMCLGSDFPTVPKSDSGAGTLGGARGESGQDNGPEYDGVDTTEGPIGPTQYNSTTGHMNLYSVQVTSHFLADAEALMAIASATGRGAALPTLQARFNASAAALNTYLWDAEDGVYTNMLFNGTLYRRRSPTTFYPLIAGVVPDDRVPGLMSMLEDPRYFCVTAGHKGPPNSTMAVHYLSQKTNGSILCGSEACVQQAIDRGEFYWVRVEAQLWAPDAGSSAPPGALQLSQWYDPATQLFASNTGTAGPPAPGYQFVRVEGLCAPSPGPGLVPLDLWRGGTSGSNHSGGAFLACGTAACATAAAAAGYTRNHTLCYAMNASTWENLPCKYGVPPSIARSDPAWNNEGDPYNYWRGRIWGPQVALVYLGLQRYDHLPQVRAVRAVLVNESRALFLHDWRAFRHVNENTNSITGTGGDNGSADEFYHLWAMTGFISLLEAGL